MPTLPNVQGTSRSLERGIAGKAAETSQDSAFAREIRGRLESPSTGDRTGSDTARTANRTVDTPFGVFQLDNPGERTVLDTGGGSEWKDYFMTHAPAEWIDDKGARDKFVEAFGAKALVTLDWNGTIPEHIEAIWKTTVAVDSNGKPKATIRNSELS